MPLPEKDLIKRIRKKAKGATAVVAGIGDDTAILRSPPGQDLLITTDFSLEKLHFRREWHSPDVVGHRCMARGISDIAAMGGKPLAAFLSLALPADVSQRWVDGFVGGLLALGKQFGVSLAGGDTAESPHGILADIVALGRVPKGTAIRRSGARPGDLIYVTGVLGGAATALQLLFSGRKLKPEDYPRHFRPLPRIKVGEYLRARKIASAMIDTSDGLSTDLAHLCEESGVGAEVLAEDIPLARVGVSGEPVKLELALHGGEDYELLFTARPDKAVPRRISGVPVTLIGSITRGRKIVLTDGTKRSQLKASGWEHFRKRSRSSGSEGRV
jgi:thiamine-monophosphate kinase